MVCQKASISQGGGRLWRRGWPRLKAETETFQMTPGSLSEASSTLSSNKLVLVSSRLTSWCWLGLISAGSGNGLRGFPLVAETVPPPKKAQLNASSDLVLMGLMYRAGECTTSILASRSLQSPAACDGALLKGRDWRRLKAEIASFQTLPVSFFEEVTITT